METQPELQALRDSIDNLDAALVHILALAFIIKEVIRHHETPHVRVASSS
ncbi:hypothetical protein AAE026_14215 [Bradyrhizobium sp. DN5]